MGHTRITPIALAGALIATSALAQAPTAQRQTPTRADQVVAPGPKTGASPTSGGAGTSAANRPGGTASQPSATGAPGALVGAGGKVDASAVGTRIGGVGGATQAQGSTTATAATPANKFQQAAAGRAAAAPDAGKPVTPADLSREAQLRQLADPKGGSSTTPNSAAATAVDGRSAADLVQGAGASPQPAAGKNSVSRQEQQSIEASDATKEQVRNALFPQGLSGQTIESVVGGAYRSLEKAAIESGFSKKYNDGRPNYAVGVRGRPTPDGPVRAEGDSLPAVGAGRAPVSSADAAHKAQVSLPVDGERRALERMTPTPEARRDMVKPSDTRTNPADGRSGDGTTPSPGASKPGGAPPPGGKAPEQVDQSRPGSKPGKKPDDPSGT
jgi:hypothetical protein